MKAGEDLSEVIPKLTEIKGLQEEGPHLPTGEQERRLPFQDLIGMAQGLTGISWNLLELNSARLLVTRLLLGMLIRLALSLLLALREEIVLSPVLLELLRPPLLSALEPR